jgi:ADP-ribose pyrophosphatase
MVAGDGSGGKKWSRLSRSELLKTHIFTVTERVSVAPDGKKGRFSVLEAPEWATVVPLVETASGQAFLMVRQYRHGSDEISIEFPGGVVEPGEEPAAAAARELEEETGYRAAKITSLGWTYPNPAIMDNRFHVFLAEDCQPDGKVCLDEHEVVDAFLVPVSEVREKMGKGQYSHALMIAALFLADRAIAEGAGSLE